MVIVSRVNSAGTFSANFMLMAAMNPCPCGYHGQVRCHCTDYAQMNEALIKEFCQLDAEGTKLLSLAFEKFHYSARTYNKFLKIARTLVDHYPITEALPSWRVFKLASGF